jgi:NAD(P)-dependent dehydrogenase (short-subunit alcohol dehydrogenase family)
MQTAEVIATPRQTAAGKVVVLTGGTTGLGVGLLSACLEADKIYLLCRSLEKGAQLVAQYPEARIELVRCELSRMADVKAAAEVLCAAGRKIDWVFLNAGLISGSTLRKTDEGIEETLAVNVCSAYLLARLLVPQLADEARLIFTGSEAGKVVKYTVDLDAMQGEHGMGVAGFIQYAKTKTLMHQIAGALSDKLDALGVKAHVSAWHPGAVKTGMANNVSPWLAKAIKFAFAFVFRTPATAAAFGMHLATAPQPLHRGWISDGDMGQPKDVSQKVIPGAEDPERCAQTWAAIEALVATALGGSENVPPLGK